MLEQSIGHPIDVNESGNTTHVFLPTFDIATSDTIEVEVVAYDDNYYNHRHRGTKNVGLTGGYGYFSSGVRKMGRIALR